MSPGEVLSSSGSVGVSLIMWSTCGIISSCGALCILELGLMFPESGGAYVYIQEALDVGLQHLLVVIQSGENHNFPAFAEIIIVQSQIQ